MRPRLGRSSEPKQSLRRLYVRQVGKLLSPLSFAHGRLAVTAYRCSCLPRWFRPGVVVPFSQPRALACASKFARSSNCAVVIPAEDRQKCVLRCRNNLSSDRAHRGRNTSCLIATSLSAPGRARSSSWEGDRTCDSPATGSGAESSGARRDPDYRGDRVTRR